MADTKGHRHIRRGVVRKTPTGTRRPWRQWREVFHEMSRRRKPIIRVLPK